jgi:glucose/arabinose dehydrogenase
MRNALASLIGAVCLLAGAARAQNPLLELVTDQADMPSYLADPNDGTGRLFISELGGRVRIFANGHLQDPNDAFLDVHNSVSLAGEGGMHSIAFDPNFAVNHYVYVEYTRPGSGHPLDTEIARYTAMDGDPNHVDPASVHIVVVLQGSDFNNHKGGQLQFGPDGFLYFAWGDGGSQDNPSCGAQEHDTLMGKMIRIDPSGDDFPMDPDRNYAIPPTNPFADPNDAILDEIWASGFRNPYRFSFDRVTGDLWIGDVGGSIREELDMQAHTSAGGENYGWKVMEGTTCHTAIPGAANCEAYVKPCNDPSYTPPLIDFAHGAGDTIIGGYVYRGATASWQGKYIFADYGRDDIFALTQNGSGFDRVVIFHREGLGPASFGQDHNGELYVLGLNDNTVSRLRFDLLGHTKPQKACVSKLNDGFVGIAGAKSAQVRACVAKAAAGKLAPLTVDQCVDADPNGKFAKLSAKTEKLDTDLCTGLPPEVGYAGFAAGNAAAIASEVDLAHDVLGAVLDDGVTPKTQDRLAAACQKAVLSALAACQSARRAEFIRCKKLGLKNDTLLMSDDLAACLDVDPKARVAKACDPTTGKIATQAIAKSCTAKGVALATAFSGCNLADPAALAACLDASGSCRTCELFNAADALETDCTTRGCAP